MEFREKTTRNWFEYKPNDTGMFPEYPHIVRVSSDPINDWGYRYAKVLKTVAYVLVDEDMVERWEIKNAN